MRKGDRQMTQTPAFPVRELPTGQRPPSAPQGRSQSVCREERSPVVICSRPVHAGEQERLCPLGLPEADRTWRPFPGPLHPRPSNHNSRASSPPVASPVAFQLPPTLPWSVMPIYLFHLFIPILRGCHFPTNCVQERKPPAQPHLQPLPAKEVLPRRRERETQLQP